MTTVLGLPAALAMLGASLWISYLLVRRLDPGAGPSLRIAAAAVVWQWLSALLFHLLIVMGNFRLFVALPVWLLAAGCCHVWLDGRDGWRQLADDLRAAARLFGDFVRSPWRALLAVGGVAVVGTRLLAGLASPPLAWDGLVYHAYKPARWVRDGGFGLERAPDVWGYMEYFPHGGEIPWAWAMLGPRNDMLLAAAGVMIWALAVGAAYSLARALNGSRVTSTYAALAVGFFPAVATGMTSTYVDVGVLAAFLLGCVSLATLAGGGPPIRALFAAAGFGLMAGTKASGLPVLGLGLLAIGWALGRSAQTTTRLARAGWILSALAVALTAAAPSYLRSWVLTGSPVYPLTVQLGGRTLLRGNEQLRQLFTGELHPFDPQQGSLWNVVASYLTPRVSRLSDDLGFTPAMLIIVGLAAWGLWALLRRHDRRALVIWLALMAFAPFAAMMTKAFEAQRTLWLSVSARLVLGAPAMLAVFAAAARPNQKTARIIGLLWGETLVVELALSFPGGLVAPVIAGMKTVALPLAAWLAGVVAVIVVMSKAVPFLAAPGRRAALGVAIVLATAAPVGVALANARARHRYPIYAASALPEPAYIMHQLAQGYVAAWPIWWRLDQQTPHRIALCAGSQGARHNAYRFPLLGARFQNHLLYVPITHDGSVVDYQPAPEVNRVADRDAWLRRLEAAKIDTVVVLDPAPPEQRWIAALPNVFEPIATGGGVSAAYRFYPERLARDAIPHPVR